jgi:hypothetical protein
MKSKYIDPKNPESEQDIIACNLIGLLKDVTDKMINELNGYETLLTPQQFNGIYNAVMNYFHHSMSTLIHCIDGKQQQVLFIKAIDGAFHHIMKQILEETDQDTIKH